MLEITQMIEDGCTLDEIRQRFKTQYLMFENRIKGYYQAVLSSKYMREFRTVKTTYIYGAARLGKTSLIYDLFPIENICRVNNYAKGTFENYQSQPILMLDEFTGAIDITFMNNILDKFPVDLPARFANRTACFNEVFVISNLSLNQLYKLEQSNAPEVFDAFKQRFKNIIRFTAFREWHYELKDGEPIPPPKQLQPKQLAVSFANLKPIEDDTDFPF